MTYLEGVQVLPSSHTNDDVIQDLLAVGVVLVKGEILPELGQVGPALRQPAQHVRHYLQ